MNSIKELLLIHENYQNAYEKWQNMHHILIKFSNQNKEFPHPEISQDQLQIVYRFTNTSLYCKFSYENDMTLLSYGYIVHDDVQCEKFVETDRHFVDTLGNISKEGKVTEGDWNIEAVNDYGKFFFPAILDALKKAWAKE